MEQIEMTDAKLEEIATLSQDAARMQARADDMMVDQRQRQDAQPSTLFDKAILLSVELRRLGVRKKVKSGAVTTDADPDSIHVSKELLESKAYEDIVSLDGEIRQYVTSRCLPGPFRAGVYLLPITTVEKVDQRLEAFKAMRERMIEKFIAEYPDRAKAAQARLGSLFDPTDYPSIEKVRASFGMNTQYVAFNTPVKLREISADIWKREQEKASATIASYAEDMKTLLRAQMAELTGKAVERLTSTEDGKAKTFRDSLIGNIKDFLATFSDKNSVFNDTELEAQADKLRKLVAGVDPALLRTDDQIRERVLKDFAEVNTALAGMVQDRPTRKLNFDA